MLTHVREYLAAAAPVCAQDGKAWLDQQKERLKANEVQAVLMALFPYMEPEAQEGQAAQAVRKACQHLSNRRTHLDYKGGAGTGIADRVG